MFGRKGCRDCKRCTEGSLAGCIALPFRVLFFIPSLFLRAGQRKCPHCGHPIAWHARDKSGRFKD